MKNASFGFVGLGLIASVSVGCAAGMDDPAADPQIDTAFLGLTLMDCQTQATECLDYNLNERRWWQLPRPCSTELAACTGEATVDTVQTTVAEVDDVVACSDEGLDCFRDARRVSEALACEQQVEACTLDSVEEITGIALPTSGELIGETVELTGEVVETAAGVAEETIETAAGVAEETVGTAVEVAGETVETAAGVAEETVGTAVEVAETTAGTLLSAADCANASRECLASGGGYFSCRADYRACMADLL